MPATGSMQEYRGTAVCDKANESLELKVYSDDLLPFAQGTIKASQMTSNINSRGSDGMTSQVQVTSQNFVTAQYRDDTAGHSLYPPDIRSGEQVILFNYGNSDTWYWRPANQNNNARRTETWCQAINDTTDNAATLGDDNTYFIRVDTRRQKGITISTAKSDGEAYRYKLWIDTAGNTVSLADDSGNFISIDSNVPKITLRNRSDTVVSLDDQDINITCKGNINIDAKKNINIAAHQKLETTSDSDTNVSSKANVNLKSEANMTISAGGALVLNFNGGSITGNGSLEINKA